MYISCIPFPAPPPSALALFHYTVFALIHTRLHSRILPSYYTVYSIHILYIYTCTAQEVYQHETCFALLKIPRKNSSILNGRTALQRRKIFTAVLEPHCPSCVILFVYYFSECKHSNPWRCVRADRHANHWATATKEPSCSSGPIVLFSDCFVTEGGYRGYTSWDSM